MELQVACPQCGKEYVVTHQQWDRSARCAKCGERFSISAENVTGASSDETPMPAKGATGNDGDKPPSQTPADDVPAKIGRFEIIGRLGAGGFGAVYRAYDPVLDREVAVKVPRPAVLASEKARARFLREPKAAAQLRHPHIVPVYDAGTDGEEYYIASAYIEGQTLDELIEEQRPDFRRCAEIVRQLAAALKYAHDLGIIHRDVKPSNVMIDAAGDALLMDFGLARIEQTEEQLTQDGAVMGTPAYMAPEQADSERHGDVGPASDQYSLGVVLYELLCGDRPFNGPPSVVIFNTLNNEPESPREKNPAIPRDLETICLKAMSKESGARYANCDELADDLRRWLEDEPIRARPMGLFERAVRWSKRNPVVASLSAVVFLSITLGLLGVSYQWRRANVNLAKAQSAANQEAQARRRADQLAKDEHAARKNEQAARLEEKAARLEADQKRQEAERLLRIAEARRLAAEAARQCNQGMPQRGLLLAIESLKVTERAGEPRVMAAEQVLRDAIRRSAGRPVAHGVLPTCVDLEHSGELLVTGDSHGRIEVRDLTAKDPIAQATAFVVDNDQVIRSLAVSQDKTKLVTRGNDGFSLWDLESQRPSASRVLLGDSPGRCLGISTDNRWLVTMEQYGVSRSFRWRSFFSCLRLWDIGGQRPNTGPIELRPSGKFPYFRHVAWGGGRWLAAEEPNGILRIWDLQSVPKPAPVEPNEIIRGRPTFSPDGRLLAAVENNLSSRIKIYRMTPKGPLATATLSQPRTAAPCVAFSPSGRWLAICDAAGGARVFDLNDSERTTPRFELRGHVKSIACAAFSSDDRWLATGSDDRTARLWDLSEQDPNLNSIVFRGHEGSVRVVAFDGHHRWLVTHAYDDGRDSSGEVRLWNVSDENADGPQVFWGEQCLGVSDDATRMATIELASKRVILWDVSALIPRRLLRRRHELVLEMDLRKLAGSLSYGGRWLAIYNPSILKLVDLAARGDSVQPKTLVRDEQLFFTGAQFSWDNHWLAVRLSNGAIKVFDLTSDTLLDSSVTLMGESHSRSGFNHPLRIEFSAGGRWLASGDVDGARLWDLKALRGPSRKLTTIRSTLPAPAQIVFSRDGGRLAATGLNRIIELWDVSGDAPQSLAALGPCDGNSFHALSPNNGWLVASKSPGTGLWDLRTDDPSASVRVLRGHEGPTWCAVFSADNRWLVTGGYDQTVRIWDLREEDLGVSSLVLRGHTDIVTRVIVSPDNRWILTQDRRGAARRWRLQLKDVVDLARQIAGRNLTDDERERFVAPLSQ